MVFRGDSARTAELSSACSKFPYVALVVRKRSRSSEPTDRSVGKKKRRWEHVPPPPQELRIKNSELRIQNSICAPTLKKRDWSTLVGRSHELLGWFENVLVTLNGQSLL